MKQYYYEENNQEFGPLTLEELRSKRIKNTTIVWTNEAENYGSADSFEELKDSLEYQVAISHLEGGLPIVEDQIKEKSNQGIAKEKSVEDTDENNAQFLGGDMVYDDEYKKETEATVVGFLLIFVNIIASLMMNAGPGVKGKYSFAINYLIAVLIQNVLVTIWVVKIAKRQNRIPEAWGVFAFFFPTLSLIIIGLSRKFKKPVLS